METIIIIDSDPGLRNSGEAALRAAGYEVISASDGVTGLELVRQKRPRIVITEIMLPGMHGFALCQEIGRAPELRSTCRVIVASSKSYPSDINQALELGAIAYLVKPFPPERLIEAVRNAMVKAPTPVNEVSRLAVLHGYNVLDPAPNPLYEGLTYVASEICGTPVALISLVDADRQWFKAKVGTELRQTSRDLAFCAHAILRPEVMVVPDATKDDRFRDNVLVTLEPKIRFYAGAPIIAPGGEEIGTLCVIDTIPRELNAGQLECLRILAQQVQALFDLHREIARLARDRTPTAAAETANA